MLAWSQRCCSHCFARHAFNTSVHTAFLIPLLFPTCCVQVLGPTDKAQSTMVAAWLTELLLDQINRDLLAAAGQHTQEYLQHVEQLR